MQISAVEILFKICSSLYSNPNRLLQEESDRRKELEKLKEQQERQLQTEVDKRKGLEQQSEELTKIQMAQTEELRKKQATLQTLADERKSADSQLQVCVYIAILLC